MDIVRDLGELTELAAEIPGVLDCLQGFRPAPGDDFSALFPLGAAGTPEPGSIFALLVEAIETDPHWENDPYLGLAHWRLWQSAHEAAATLLGRAAAEAEGLNDDYEFPTWSECTWVSDHGRVIFVADCFREAGLEGEAMSLESAGKTRTRC